jgi:hypothetical protein
MQPDTIPPVSCCGEADAYWDDQVSRRSQWGVIATITDDRDAGPLKRMHEDKGNKHIVPPNKNTKKDGNATAAPSSFLVLLRYLACEVSPETCPLLRDERWGVTVRLSLPRQSPLFLLNKFS